MEVRMLVHERILDMGAHKQLRRKHAGGHVSQTYHCTKVSMYGACRVFAGC